MVDYLEERGDVKHRVGLPEGIEGMSERELSRLVRQNRTRLERFSKDRGMMLPTNFRVHQEAA